MRRKKREKLRMATAPNAGLISGKSLGRRRPLRIIGREEAPTAVSIESKQRRRRIREATVREASLSSLSTEEDEVTRHPPQRQEDFEDRGIMFMKTVNRNKRRVVAQHRTHGVRTAGGIIQPMPERIEEQVSPATAGPAWLTPTAEEIRSEFMPQSLRAKRRDEIAYVDVDEANDDRDLVAVNLIEF